MKFLNEKKLKIMNNMSLRRYKLFICGNFIMMVDGYVIAMLTAALKRSLFMKTKMKPWKKQTTKSKVTSIIGNQMVVNMTEIYLILK